MDTDQERTWCSLAHMTALTGLLVPFGNILAPWLVLHFRGPLSAQVAGHARESLNFNISVVLAALVCLALTWVSVGGLLGAALLVYWIAMTLFATLQAGEGHPYRYPFSLRLVK